MKIMIVDDSKAMRQIIRRSLRQAGFENHDYTEAANGIEALAAIEADSPDLVLSDWNMPDMSGIELLGALMAAGKNVRFGFITSESSASMRSTAADAGALFLLAKPFTPDTLRETLAPFIPA